MAQYAKYSEAEKLIPKYEDVEAVDLDTLKLVDWIREYIDTELRGRYVLPFSTTGSALNEQADEKTLRGIAENLTAGLALHLRHMEDAAGKMPDNWWWNKGSSQLNRVKALKLDLDPDHATLDTSGTYRGRRIKATQANWPPTFNKGNELGWRKPVLDTTGNRDQRDPDDYKAQY